MSATVYAVLRDDATLAGWVQQRSTGGWRALTPSGVLTHHRTRKEAREALQCSM
jgi:hypothetical protein